MKKFLKNVLALSLLIFVLQACYNDKADKLYGVKTTTSCDTASVSFKTTVLPILQQNCAISACHDPSTQSNGYNFNTYNSVAAAIQTNNDQFIGSISHNPKYIAMPNNGGKLADCDINKIEAWVNSGYPNN